MKTNNLIKWLALLIIVSVAVACTAPEADIAETTVPAEEDAGEEGTTTSSEDTSGDETETELPDEGDEPVEFVFAHPGPIDTLDAPVTWFLRTHWVANQLYDCLIWRKADGSGYEGQSAESWEQIDELTWRFNLRPGLTFHNGEALDAEAVKWNIDRVRSRDDFMVQPQWAFIDEVIVVDETTVDITTNQPEAYFEYFVSFNGCQLLPPEYMEEVGEEEFARNPVGSGPYVLAEFTPSERYVFEAWDDYWAGRPEVDRVIYQVIPESASQVAALLAGQVDLIVGFQPSEIDRLTSAEGIEVMAGPANRAASLVLRTETESGNMAETYPGYEPVTLDKNVRHAISRALDRTLLAEIQGSAVPTLVRVPQAWPEAHADEYAGPANADEWYDPEYAKELLVEAGYDPDSGNGPTVYFDAPGFEFGNEREVVEAIAVMLEEVGFNVELNILDSSAYLEQIHSPGNNRDIMWVTLGGAAPLVPLFYQCNWFDLYYHVCVEEWDEVSNEILQTFDQEERVELWGEWWEYYLDVAVYATIFEMQNQYAISDRFEWAPRADSWMTFRDVKINR